VTTLASFLASAKKLAHGATVRVKTCDLNGKKAVFTLKTDHNYWRGYEVFAEGDQWVQRIYDEVPVE